MELDIGSMRFQSLLAPAGGSFDGQSRSSSFPAPRSGLCLDENIVRGSDSTVTTYITAILTKTMDGACKSSDDTSHIKAPGRGESSQYSSWSQTRSLAGKAW